MYLTLQYYYIHCRMNNKRCRELCKRNIDSESCNKHIIVTTVWNKKKRNERIEHEIKHFGPFSKSLTFDYK